MVRALPADSVAQKAAKLALPFATWAGVFSRRGNDALVRHSGQCGVDLDGLGYSVATAVIQTAVADQHCLAAFRSTRGEGVRLLFRVPPCSAQSHKATFDQVAQHVRQTYQQGPDASGSDVSRASFVSYDNGLWLNASAMVLPIRGTGRMLHSDSEKKTRCVTASPYSHQLALTCWGWFGRNYGAAIPESSKTHGNLLDLGKAIALHADRLGVPLSPAILNEASESWLNETRRLGLKVRGTPEEYRRELRTSALGARTKPWFREAAEKWIRWTRHAEFPHFGTPAEKLMFAIRGHCADGGKREFWLGVRDAALLIGASSMSASRLLNKLATTGHLLKLDKPKQFRHAQSYRLKA